MSEYKRLTCGEFDGQCDHFCLSKKGCYNNAEERFMLCEDCIHKERYDRLAELEDKIENGTLIELPCKVGDTVYFPIDNGWDCAEIDEIHIFEKDIVFEWVQYDRGYELTELWDEGDFSIYDIGKTVFLTRTEAEKKLKELQNDR